MHPVNSVLREYLFLIPLIVLLLSEFTKVMIRTVKEGEDPLRGHWVRWLFQPGGIPSTHSAFVTSLLIVVGRKMGTNSTEFAIAFVLACIVWYDALSVRYQVGKQAEVLNKLQHWKRFSERLGHSFTEVLVGIAFGAAVTMLGVVLS
ncbi:MAG: divergent PAP2 family protein [Candidatus Peribacteraceae bacterium]|nr:divergent PAP2 family protein [Candidatus Peribacteraceae bacterium]